MRQSFRFITAHWIYRGLVVLCVGILLPWAIQQPVAEAACDAAPARPSLQVPPKGDSLSERRVKLAWKPVRCATHYSVEIRKGAKDGRPLDAGYDLPKPKYTTRRLDTGTSYYWTVDACNDHGCTTSRWGNFYLSK